MSEQEININAIEKIEEFAQTGDRSLRGMDIPAGFPKQQKPYRQWFNYLFNWLSSKTNEVIDEVNANRAGITILNAGLTKLRQDVEPLFEPIAVGELLVTTKSYPSGFDVAEDKGYGKWVRYAEGRTLVGFSSQSSDPSDYKKMGNKFGANTHKLTIDEMPNHDHKKKDYDNNNAGGDRGGNTMHYGEAGIGAYQGDFSSGYTGGDKAHNNIQPSIVVAYWLRVE